MTRAGNMEPLAVQHEASCSFCDVSNMAVEVMFASTVSVHAFICSDCVDLASRNLSCGRAIALRRNSPSAASAAPPLAAHNLAGPVEAGSSDWEITR